MTRYALFVRGINVGTKNSLAMADLRDLLNEIGCTDVATYVQSGNAVFATRLAEKRLTRAIEEGLTRLMGREIRVTLRTEAELASVVAANPLDAHAASGAKLCVTFLSDDPSSEALAPLTSRRFEPDVFRVLGREIYSFHPHGQGKSALAAALSKLRLPGAVTTRNWNTVTKVLALLGS